jgi:DNA-binding MarR family transcriptional regulator
MKLEAKARELARHFRVVKERLQGLDKNNPSTRLLLNGQEAHAIYSIGARHVMTMSEIADSLHLTLSSVTTLVDKLQEKSLVKRDRCGEDRRIVHVALTPEGHRLYRMVENAQLKLTCEMLKALNAEEQDLFLDMFRRIAGKIGETMPVERVVECRV